MSRPWMPLYIADYLADTAHLSTIEHGAYMLLIMHYWQHSGLPEDEKRIARICRMSPDEWAESRDALADLFDDGWRHGRIEQELAEAQEKYRKRAEAGRKGGKAKAEDKHCSSNASAGLNQPQPQPHSEKEEPTGSSKKRAVRLPDDFEPDWAFAAKNGFDRQQAQAELDRMRDWSRSAKNGAKLDWQAAWRNWIRNAQRPTPQARGSPPPRHETDLQRISRQLRERQDDQRRADFEFDGPVIQGFPG